MSTTQTILFIILGLSVLVSTTSLILSIYIIKNLKRKIDYDMIANHNTEKLLKDIGNGIVGYIQSDHEETNKSITSLSSSIKGIIEENKSIRNKKIYPTPQLSEMIGATIKEQLMTEFVFQFDQRVKRGDVLRTISEIVCATYPHVNEEYIARRVTMEVQKFSANTNTNNNQ